MKCPICNGTMILHKIKRIFSGTLVVYCCTKCSHKHEEEERK